MHSNCESGRQKVVTDPLGRIVIFQLEGGGGEGGEGSHFGSHFESRKNGNK